MFCTKVIDEMILNDELSVKFLQNLTVWSVYEDYRGY